MKPYTVLLLYPDNVSDNRESYLTHVEADNVQQAQGMAQMEAMIVNGLDPEFYDPVSFRVLATFEGHLEDLSTY